MSKTNLSASPELCRLKTAAALIPIIDGGIADSKISHERAALMLTFCEWAADIEPEALIRFTRGVEGAIRTAARLIDFALATWALLAAHPDAVFSLDENGGLSVQFAEAQEEGDDD